MQLLPLDKADGPVVRLPLGSSVTLGRNEQTRVRNLLVSSEHALLECTATSAEGSAAAASAAEATTTVATAAATAATTPVLTVRPAKKRVWIVRAAACGRQRRSPAGSSSSSDGGSASSSAGGVEHLPAGSGLGALPAPRPPSPPPSASPPSPSPPRPLSTAAAVIEEVPRGSGSARLMPGDVVYLLRSAAGELSAGFRVAVAAGARATPVKRKAGTDEGAEGSGAEAAAAAAAASRSPSGDAGAGPPSAPRLFEGVVVADWDGRFTKKLLRVAEEGGARIDGPSASRATHLLVR